MLAHIFIAIQGIIYIGVIIIIIFLIFRRIELKKKEDFEKRDN